MSFSGCAVREIARLARRLCWQDPATVPYPPHPVHTRLHYLFKLRLHRSFLCGYSTVTSSALFIFPVRETFGVNCVTVVVILDDGYKLWNSYSFLLRRVPCQFLFGVFFSNVFKIVCTMCLSEITDQCFVRMSNSRRDCTLLLYMFLCCKL